LTAARVNGRTLLFVGMCVAAAVLAGVAPGFCGLNGSFATK
jgi:hypothetical protein